jgi:hypothetical protein
VQNDVIYGIFRSHSGSRLDRVANVSQSSPGFPTFHQHPSQHLSLPLLSYLLSTMLPILPGDIKVDLGQGRHPDLPQIFQTPSHPLWKSEGNIYYYLQDLSGTGMKRSADLERCLRIPHGPETQALDEGGVIWVLSLMDY